MQPGQGSPWLAIRVLILGYPRRRIFYSNRLVHLGLGNEISAAGQQISVKLVASQLHSPKLVSAIGRGPPRLVLTRPCLQTYICTCSSLLTCALRTRNGHTYTYRTRSKYRRIGVARRECVCEQRAHVAESHRDTNVACTADTLRSWPLPITRLPRRPNVIHCSCQIHATTENFLGIVRETTDSWPPAVRLFRHVTQDAGRARFFTPCPRPLGASLHFCLIVGNQDEIVLVENSSFPFFYPCPRDSLLFDRPRRSFKSRLSCVAPKCPSAPMDIRFPRS